MIEVVEKTAFDGIPSRTKETLLMETAMRIQEVFDDMWFSQHVNPDKVDLTGSLERFLMFCDWAREFEDRYYETDRYDDDWLEFSREFAETKIKEVFG